MNLSILKRNAVVGLTGPTWSPIALLVCPYSSCRCLFRECFNLNQTRSLAIFNFSIEGPEKKRKKKNKLPRLAKAFFIRVAESNRNFYIFLSHAYMKCPLQRRHHESYSESLAVKIGWFEQSCPDLSKVSKSTRFVRTCGIFTHRKVLPTRPKICMYVPPCLPAGRKFRDTPPFW